MVKAADASCDECGGRAFAYLGSTRALSYPKAAREDSRTLHVTRVERIGPLLNELLTGRSAGALRVELRIRIMIVSRVYPQSFERHRIADSPLTA